MHKVKAIVAHSGLREMLIVGSCRIPAIPDALMIGKGQLTDNEGRPFAVFSFICRIPLPLH